MPDAQPDSQPVMPLEYSSSVDTDRLTRPIAWLIALMSGTYVLNTLIRFTANQVDQLLRFGEIAWPTLLGFSITALPQTLCHACVLIACIRSVRSTIQPLRGVATWLMVAAVVTAVIGIGYPIWGFVVGQFPAGFRASLVAGVVSSLVIAASYFGMAAVVRSVGSRSNVTT